MLVSFFPPLFLYFLSNSISVCVLVVPAVSPKLNDHIDAQINRYTYTRAATRRLQTVNKLMPAAVRTRTHTETQSDTHLQGNSSQLLVSSVNLFCTSWIWQCTSSTASNTQTNEFISSTPPFSPPVFHICALVSRPSSPSVVPSASIRLSRALSALFVSLASLRCFLFLFSARVDTLSLHLHRWFRRLLWVLIIPSITVGKCAIKVDGYSVPRGSVFIRVTTGFRGLGRIFRRAPRHLFCHLFGRREGHLVGICTVFTSLIFFSVEIPTNGWNSNVSIWSINN